jgi:CheY-like chemotaxis protein
MHSLNKPHRQIDVLIAEDDASTRLMVRQMLENDGLRCAEADDGCTAVDLARQCHPRLALLDVMMPGMDGFRVARELRSDPQTRDIQINFFTALDDRNTRATARRVGGEVVFSKPIDVRELVDAVRISLACCQEPAGSTRG